MRVDRLEITNFKKFSNYTIDLHPQFTLLVGANGMGKTTILDALAIAAGVWLVNAPDSTLSNSGRNILPTEIRLEAVKTGDRRTRLIECKPVQIATTGQIGEANIQWLRQINQKGSRTSNAGSKQVLEIINNLTEGDRAGANIWFPVIGYYGAGRAWLPSNKRDGKAKQNSPSRRWDAFYECFEERIRIADIQNWFQKEAIASVNQQGKMRSGYQVVEFAILRCIPDADAIWFDPDRLEIFISIDRNPQPFSNLSAGQKMMVALIADIAIKVVNQNAAFLTEELSIDERGLPLLLQQTPGLVLIDEIDVHLHPKWQRQVVNDLKTTFPSIQFVCTTHSPFIIQSIEQGELRILDLEHTHSLAYANQSIEDIAEDIQQVEVPQQSLKARELDLATQQYFELLQNPDQSQSQQLATAEATYRQAVEPFSSNPGLSALLKLEAMAKAKEKSQ